MAFITQETKVAIAAKVKLVLKKYNIKGTMSIKHNSMLVLTLTNGSIDFIANLNETCGADNWQLAHGFAPVTCGYTDVNPYHYERHFSGRALDCIHALLANMNEGNWNNSDLQSDYVDVGWYVAIKIGKWNKPYCLVQG